ncbi:hypothetical protein B0I37DRAFT_405649 [Chaetomium sp. MPI-CAGE-AT-0009]|nr:hypothetical protein B0I37DRAFT_405649 [Chaetomium sp. MPI-CAGE-AT-0009]
MKPVTAIIVAALAQSANVFVAAECQWYQCWKVGRSFRGPVFAGSDVCQDKCREDRWQSRSILHLSAWGCRMDDADETDRQNIADYHQCCMDQGASYRWRHSSC